MNKGIYNKDIIQFIKEKKLLESQLTNSPHRHKKLIKKIKKCDKLIEHKIISEFDIDFIKSKRSIEKSFTAVFLEIKESSSTKEQRNIM